MVLKKIIFLRHQNHDLTFWSMQSASEQHPWPQYNIFRYGERLNHILGYSRFISGLMFRGTPENSPEAVGNCEQEKGNPQWHHTRRLVLQVTHSSWEGNIVQCLTWTKHCWKEEVQLLGWEKTRNSKTKENFQKPSWNKLPTEDNGKWEWWGGDSK